MEDDREELRALVVGFLQGGFKENPHGYTLQEFERYFPERTDEPHDWYKRYNKKSILEALECIQDSVRVHVGGSGRPTVIQLNPKAGDSHLIDLISHQKPSTKRKKSNFKPHYQKVMSSFAMNNRFPSAYRGDDRLRLNLNQDRRTDSFIKRKQSPPLQTPKTSSRPTIYKEPVRAAPGDPRSRQSSTSMVPPQVKPPSVASTRPKTSSTQTSNRSQIVTSSRGQAAVQAARDAAIDRVSADPIIDERKIKLRQRLFSMLTRKYSEIKLMFLNNLYQLEYEETIDLPSLGHKNMTNLLQDPILSEHIKLNFKSPWITISAKCGETSEKENIASGDRNLSNCHSDMQDSSADPLGDKSNTLSASKAKLNAIDPFNVRTMLQSLEPLGEVKEPPLKNNLIDDVVKYKTMRIIFRDPNLTLKLDDWERKFEQESRLKIRIRDYGFKTLLEFFKKLASELPIKIRLNNRDEWIAVGDFKTLSGWLQQQMSKCHYRAITVIDANYELVALPTDSFMYTKRENLPQQEYYPAVVLSVKYPSYMWIQLRTRERIEDHLCIEASLTCYEDYKKKGLFKVPEAFVRPGFPCAVYEETQQRWCRAVIIRAPENIDRNHEITALLVDYAITRNFAISQLSCLMKTHLKSPVGPMYTKLHGVKDSSNRKAKMILQEYTSPPVTLACKFVATVQSGETMPFLPKECYEVTLIDTRQGKDCNLSDDINVTDSKIDE